MGISLANLHLLTFVFLGGLEIILASWLSCILFFNIAVSQALSHDHYLL